MVTIPRSVFIALSIFVFLTLAACGDNSKAIVLTAQEENGKLLFSQNCAACHATSADLVIVGPSLAGIKERAENQVAEQDGFDYINESILIPGAFVNEGFTDLMPATFGEILTVEEIEALIAYLYVLE